MIKITSEILSQTLLILITSGIIGYSVYIHSKSEPIKNVSSVRVMDAQYAADFSDDKVLVGASHNIFIGKVLKQVSTEERGIGPETQFSVQVVDNIKGELKDIVIVNQEGGYKNGKLYIFSEDRVAESIIHPKKPHLLQPGSTYLFSTRYNKEGNWYTLNPYSTASKILSTDSEKEDYQLKSIAEADSRVQALKTAYENEILLEADVKNNNTLNSYKSAQKDALR